MVPGKRHDPRTGVDRGRARGCAPADLKDTNIYRSLATGKLDSYKSRLLQIAKFRTPPILWACEITTEELLGHIRPEEAARFAHFRDALEWMDRLCGNLGMAETLPWILRRGVFATIKAHDTRLSTTFNYLRRRVIKAAKFGDLDPDLLSNLAGRRINHLDRVRDWATRLAMTLDEIQVRIKKVPGAIRADRCDRHVDAGDADRHPEPGRRRSK